MVLNKTTRQLKSLNNLSKVTVNLSYSTSSTQQEATNQTPKVSLPSSAKVVICGGGLFATSIAYHLGQLGYKNVVLITRDV